MKFTSVLWVTLESLSAGPGPCTQEPQWGNSENSRALIDCLGFYAAFNNFSVISRRPVNIFPEFQTSTRQLLAKSWQLSNLKQRWMTKIATRSRTCPGSNRRHSVHKRVTLRIELTRSVSRANFKILSETFIKLAEIYLF